jgi:hypothetical protein
MKRTSLLSLALLIPVSAAACGSDDGGSTAQGDHYKYVVATLDTRATNKLDIDGNGVSENKLGDLIGLLTVAKFMVQEAVDEAVSTGVATLLADVQTTSFTGASGAGVSFYLGDSATIMPAPCTDKSMLSTCGQHLKGTGSFTVQAGAPKDTLLTGSIAAGTFKGGPGKIAIQIALTGTPITVNLINAKAQLSEITADGIGKGLVGGAVTQAELDASVFPGIAGQLTEAIKGCKSGTACMCNAMTMATAESIRSTFDSDNNCMISPQEVKANNILASGLNPDLTIDGQKAVSVVLGFTAKKATFTP